MNPKVAKPGKGKSAPGEGSPETLRAFIPTPERVSQYLEMNTKEVIAQLESVEGREKLHQKLLEHQEDLKKIDPSFRPESLRHQLDLVGDTLTQKKKFLDDVQSPEKKGVFRRAWDKVKGFAKKHPVITTLLVLALVAGGVGSGLYLSGAFQAKQAGVAIETLKQFFQGTDVVNPGIGPMDGFNSLEGVPIGK